MTATAATTKDRGYGPHSEHAPPGEANSEWGMCPEYVRNLWTIDNLAADLRDMANWPGSSDDHDDVGLLLSNLAADLRDMANWPGSSDDHDDVGLLLSNLAADLRDMANWPGSSDDHDDVGLLLSSLASIVEVAKQDETPELIARDLAKFLEARKTS